VQGKGDVLMVPFFQPIELGATPMLDSTLTGLDAALGGALSQLLCTSEFTGALGSSATTALPAAAPFAKCAAIGLGKPTGFRSLGAMYVTWGELIARFTRRERYEVAVAVLPRIDGGLDESLGFDERGMVIAAGPGRSLPQAVGPPPEPLSLPPAKPSPLEALGRVASMFAPSGSSAAGPSAAQQAAAARQQQQAAAQRADAALAQALAALAQGEFTAAYEAITDARQALKARRCRPLPRCALPTPAQPPPRRRAWCTPSHVRPGGARRRRRRGARRSKRGRRCWTTCPRRSARRPDWRWKTPHPGG